MRVGTRQKVRMNNYAQQDHPHACGDKYASAHGDPENWGSSPCVWGQALSRTSQTLSMRIIPMRVGTSLHPLLFQRQT